jgi:hypothetical protein
MSKSKRVLVAVGLAASLFAVSSATAQPVLVTSNIEFGPYVNCLVKNNSNRPVMITGIQYNFNGSAGPGGYFVQCVVNCGLNPGAWNRFSGQANNGYISEGSCVPNYRFL